MDPNVVVIVTISSLCVCICCMRKCYPAHGQYNE